MEWALRLDVDDAAVRFKGDEGETQDEVVCGEGLGEAVSPLDERRAVSPHEITKAEGLNLVGVAEAVEVRVREGETAALMQGEEHEGGARDGRNDAQTTRESLRKSSLPSTKFANEPEDASGEGVTAEELAQGLGLLDAVEVEAGHGRQACPDVWGRQGPVGRKFAPSPHSAAGGFRREAGGGASALCLFDLRPPDSSLRSSARGLRRVVEEEGVTGSPFIDKPSAAPGLFLPRASRIPMSCKLHPDNERVSPWERLLWEQSREPRPRASRPPLTMVIPSSAQIPTPNREFLLTTPSEGVSYVATAARDAGWDVEIVDMRLGLSDEQAAARAVERGGVVAMPTFADSYLHNERVLRLVKESCPELPTLLGGSLISSLPDPILRHVQADFSVLGEGELGLLELLDHLERGGDRESAMDIPGLAIRDDQGGVHLTPPREQIRDLDALPIPDLFLYPSVQNDPSIPEIGITTQRGCYARCAFCFVNIRKIRFKSVPRVEEEIGVFLRDHHVRYMYLNDLTFTADRKRTWSLCEALGRTGITWSCSTRVEAADPELLAHMHANGCRDIWYGVESVDQTVLDACNKRQTVEQIIRAIEDTQAAGIKVAANFIVGLPGESLRSLQAMYDFIREKDVVPASIKYLSPFPGTPIYDDAIRRGIIKDHIGYLEHLARRQVNRVDDEYYNVTDLPDSVIRDAFEKICALRDEQMARHFPETSGESSC